MRLQGCRQCEQITSGDCGQHGPLVVPLSHAVPDTQLFSDKDAEIAHLRAENMSLRAEVERLTVDVEGQRGAYVMCVGENGKLRQKLTKAEAVVRAAEEVFYCSDHVQNCCADWCKSCIDANTSIEQLDKALAPYWERA